MTQKEKTELLPNLDPQTDLKNQLKSRVRTANQYIDDNFLLLFDKMVQCNGNMRMCIGPPNSSTTNSVLHIMKSLHYDLEHKDEEDDDEDQENRLKK